jgi:urea ABC transporter ATP-binding protein UrtD
VSTVLQIENLSKRFRGLVANEAVDLSLAAGEVRAIIGPNGAGKTTLLSMISGHHAPTEGRIVYKGRDVTRLPVEARARLGILRKFQTPSVFDNLTAAENIELAVLRTACPWRERAGEISKTLEIIRLSDQADKPVKFLSHGQRQWLEIGLLLAARGELLLLDEPAAGMTKEESASTGELINHLAHERRLSVIVIEHDIGFVRDLGARVTVLHLGRILVEGTFDEVSANQQVRDVYLGH